MNVKNKNLKYNKKMILCAIKDAFKKLSPKTQLKNPIMMLTYFSSILTSILFLLNFFAFKDDSAKFTFCVAVLLWATVLLGNFAEAIAEEMGKAQADSLRAAKHDVIAHKVEDISEDKKHTDILSSFLKKGDVYVVYAGEQIPADGRVVYGVASVDEAAITGESAPVIREAGGDRSDVTGGTTLLSDKLIVEVTQNGGDSFLDKMIAMVEGNNRKKTPNEKSVETLLMAMSMVCIGIVVILYIYLAFSSNKLEIENPISVTLMIGMFVALAPTTIGALLSSVGVAGMNRLNQVNVLARSGSDIETAGDVDVLLLDKTGTITLGNRQACAFLSVEGYTEQALADAAQLCSLADETPEGRSIVILAKKKFNIRERQLKDKNVTFIPFSSNTKMSGVNIEGTEIRKGAAEAVRKYVEDAGEVYSQECKGFVQSIAKQGGTPLVVVKNHKIMGVIHLKDPIKNGVQGRFADLRKMGIKTIMVTGDNSMTAANIAAEAGVDNFLAEATPETKLKMIRDFQEKGHLVAMTGDGTNDAPALAQANVAVAMNSGTQAAKEAGNMIDLDSSPTKLIDIVRIGKQLRMTRCSLTTFTIANAIAECFIIIPMLLIAIYPNLSEWNIMEFGNVYCTIFSACLYNVLIIPALIPLALKGVKHREVSVRNLYAKNFLIYGVGGVAIPFIVIKVIDIIINLISIV